MKKILVIESSPRGEQSATRKVTKAIVEKLQAQYPGSTVHTRDLTARPLSHVNGAILKAYFTPPNDHSVEDRKAIQDSEESLNELFEADILVVGAPMWNFGIPSVLKAWIDHIVRAGKTFKYGENGPVGLIEGKRAFLAVATGGIYSDGPFKAADFVEPYLRTVLGFIGIKEVTVVRAEGLSLPGIQDTAVQKAVQSIRI